MGGNPLSVIRLSGNGAEIVRRWFRGDKVSGRPAHLELLARLARAKMVHPALTDSGRDPEQGLLDNVVAVVPVRDDPVGLAATLRSLGNIQTIVVDDGSRQPLLDRDLPASAALVSLSSSGGPGVARNAGLNKAIGRPLAAEDSSSAPHPDRRQDQFVLFVDAGVTLGPAAVSRLLTVFGPSGFSPSDCLTEPVLAAAPRVRSTPGPGAISGYEELASPLDLGPWPTLVGPGEIVSYLPTACLMVRVSALTKLASSSRSSEGECSLELFNPELRFGEDVDLIWRACQHGQVRYCPEIEAFHTPRSSLGELVLQRFQYGSSAGPLGLLHGQFVAPLRAAPVSLAIAAAGLAIHPFVAALGTIASGAHLASKLPTQLFQRHGHGQRLAWSAHSSTALALGRSIIRPWWPVSFAALVFIRRLRQPLATLMVLGIASKFKQRRDRGKSKLHPILALLLGVLDDVAYSSGVWFGALRSRSLQPLVPRFGRPVVNRYQGAATSVTREQ